MKVISDKPFPLLKEVVEKFPFVADNKDRVVFAYGEDLYASEKADIPAHLLVHEATHSVQQLVESNDGVDGWWDRYLKDNAFRLAQEIQAYRNQYSFYCQTVKDRNARAKFLTTISKDLSSDLYGSLCTFKQAYDLIRNAA